MVIRFLAAFLFFGLFTWGYSLTQTTSSTPTINLSDPKIIATGKDIFARSCSAGYCHGKEGRSGRGPRLRGRDWDKNYLFEVTLEGVPSSSMPAWKDKLSENEIWSVVAYILTLSRLTSESSEPADVADAAPPSPAIPPRAEKLPEIASGSSRRSPEVIGSPEAARVAGDPEKGRSLFFDFSNDLNCSLCHKVQGVGSDVGPDLSKVRQKPAKEILRDIILPGAALSPNQGLLIITTKAGEQINGLKVEENARQLRVYDVGNLPPVLRTLDKEEIQTRQVQTRSAMPEKYGEIYTLRQLLDIIAFLKSGDPKDSSPVTLQDLF
jgi:putative heme-binding domain-containing protein